MICILLSCNLSTSISGAYETNAVYDTASSLQNRSDANVGIASGSDAGISGGGGAGQASSDSKVPHATGSDVRVPAATASEATISNFLLLDGDYAVVYTYEELKEALSKDNGVTTVYLGSDIEMKGGIRVSSAKANVVLDGTWEGERYRLTDYNSATYTDTIYIDQKGIESFTVQNIDLLGRNYYTIDQSK